MNRGSEYSQSYHSPNKGPTLRIHAIREKTHDIEGGTMIKLATSGSTGISQYLDPDGARTRLKDLRSKTTQPMTVPSSSTSSALPPTGDQQSVEDPSPLDDLDFDAYYGWSWSDLAELPEELKTMYGIP